MQQKCVTLGKSICILTHADMESVIFYITGTFSLAILPQKRVKFKKIIISDKTLYLPLRRVVLHIVVTNGVE